MSRALTPDELDAWRRDGFVVRRDAFALDEVDRLLADSALAIERCREANAIDRAQYFVFANADGESASICAGLDHSGTAFEALCRDPRLVDPAMQLFGERQYVHHAKFMNKAAFEGVAWLWHQDYGYWQDMGSIRPVMFSAMVFLDPATHDNGCLQVLPGSHRDGRVAHRTAPTATPAAVWSRRSSMAASCASCASATCRRRSSPSQATWCCSTATSCTRRVTTCPRAIGAR